MAVKTKIERKTLEEILTKYDIGTYTEHHPISTGNVQTNLILTTSKSKYIFRYYENRSKGSVIFECNLIDYLKKHKYPCPGVLKSKENDHVGILDSKPYVIFEFMEGEHLKTPTKDQKNQLIKQVAELQIITEGYTPINVEHRWNYSPELCLKIAKEESKKIGTKNATKKLAWLRSEIEKLELPESLPLGICHCDFHFSNVLFDSGNFNALIDFDDANYTYITFDLASLIEPYVTGFDWNTWQNFKHDANVFDFKDAQKVVEEYTKHRPLSEPEKKHLFDVYKLAILFDTIWFFERGEVEDFFEKRKIDYLNNLGRDGFYQELFT